MLDSDIKKRLEAAHQNEPFYRPNAQIAAQLQEKTLVMFIGPAAIGKSFIMNALIKASPDFGRAPVFTTREARPDDEPGMFRSYPHNNRSVSALLDLIEAHEVVQYAVHPTTGHLYGTMLQDYSKPMTLLPTLSSVAESIRQLPFKQVITIGLAAEPEVWKRRFNQRYPQHSDQREKRKQEAIASLEWLLAPNQQPHVRWVDNTPDSLDHTIRSIIDIVKYNNQGNAQAHAYAQRMYESATHI